MDALFIPSQNSYDFASGEFLLPQTDGTAASGFTEVTRQNPHRELGWNPLDQGNLSLVAQQFGDFLFVNYSISSGNLLQRHRASNGWTVHRCPGYTREEIALSTSVNDSVVISHTTPSPREICIVCGKSV